MLLYVIRNLPQIYIIYLHHSFNFFIMLFALMLVD